jgi:hypothetical protein
MISQIIGIERPVPMETAGAARTESRLMRVAKYSDVRVKRTINRAAAPRGATATIVRTHCGAVAV